VARQVEPNAWVCFWQTVVRFQTDKLHPWLALRNALGVALPLAAGVALGHVNGGLAMATGALNVSFSDGQEPYRQRGKRMLAASVLVGFAVFAGALGGHNNAAAVVIATPWAFATGMLVALSTTAADLGGVSLVTLVVYMAFPQPFERAAYGGLLAFCGGLLQTVLALAFWPLRRYVYEQRAVGNLYAEMARTAASPVRATEAPPASAQSTAAQNTLATLAADHSVEAERVRLLLSQAERMRLGLMVLGRLRTRLEREESPESALLQHYFEICSRVLNSIARALQEGEAADSDPGSLRDLESLAERLRVDDRSHSAEVAAMVRDARFQMDALTGQLRTAVELAGHVAPSGLAEFERSEAGRPWRLRLIGTVATLRANLSLESAACRHAIRLAVSVAAGTAIARGFELRRSYWVPMTIAIVLKPEFTATFSRGVLRVAGTVAGLIVATVLFHVLPQGLFVEVALIAGLMFLMRYIGPANYSVLTTAVTALVVLLIAMTGVSPQPVMAARAWNTAVGGAVALLAYWLWPTWERAQAPEAIARMLDAYRAYFRAVRLSYETPETALAAERDRVRLPARLARSNVEASIDRLFAEPGTSAETKNSLSGILASSHRMVHAMMALEAGQYSSQPVPARPEFRKFADDVEFTLYYLAAALRGSPLTRDALPDLREDHYALVHGGDDRVERYALVNVETDRITNSLNTLSEDLLRWIGE